MNEERTGKCLRQMEHIRGHLWHRLPRSWLITWCVTKLTHRVSLVKQERFTLPENLSSHPDLSGVRNTRSLVLYVCLVDRCLSFLTLFFCPLCFLFPFDIRILNTLWYFQTLLYGVGDIHFVTSVTETKKKPNKSTAPLFKFSEVSNYIFFCI